MKPEEAIEIVQAVKFIDDFEDYSDRLEIALDMAIEALKEQRPHGEWIPCSERLPEKDGKYLVTAHGYISQKNEVTTAIFVSTTKEFYPNCIAWMPLPEPYKKEGEAK